MSNQPPVDDTQPQAEVSETTSPSVTVESAEQAVSPSSEPVVADQSPVAEAAPEVEQSAAQANLNDPQAEREASNYDNPIASRELILEVIHQDGAMSHETLIDRLGLETEEQLEALRRRLNAMVRDGQLIRNRKDGYVPVNEEDLISGRVIAHPDGFGFLVPDEGGDDIFLHGKQMRRLMHDDRAVVQISGVDRRGRREGAVIDVIERANTSIVGRLFIESGIAYVVPDNKRLTEDVHIPSDQLGEAQDGQIVIVEITQYPTHRHGAIGKIVDVIGDHMAPGMEIDVAIRAHNIPFEWPEEVQQAVAGMSEEVLETDKHGRIDMRDWPLVTIDGEDTKDFDDAVYCEPADDGGWRLFVAIADVSHYVERGSPLDEEAYVRSTSVYFPERVIPMLPEILSNGLCSINPGVDRLCMTAEILFDKNGEVLHTEFFEGVMNSHARLTYNEVAAILVEKDAATIEKYKALNPHLTNLYGLYQTLLKQRKRRGSIDFDTTETRIVFAEDKHIEKIVPTTRNDAHKIIEECMIAANVAAAKFINKHKVPALYRNHEGPKEEKIDDVRDFIHSIGLQFPKSADKIEAKDYAAIIQQVQDRPDFHLIQTILLRSMKQAVYGADCEGHFGLSLDAYTHFTSPIRRYPDLLVHRALKHLIAGKPVKKFLYSRADMQLFGEHCSMTDRRADEATRDAVDWLKCEYMLDRIGEDYNGTVSSVTGFGLFVELDDIYVEGLVHITNLKNDYYAFDPVKHVLVGENTASIYRLGDRVRVQVTGVSLEERKIDFEMLELLEHRLGHVHGDMTKRSPASRKRKGKKKTGKKKTAKKKAGKKKTTKKQGSKKKTGKKKNASRRRRQK